MKSCKLETNRQRLFQEEIIHVQIRIRACKESQLVNTFERKKTNKGEEYCAEEERNVQKDRHGSRTNNIRGQKGRMRSDPIRPQEMPVTLRTGTRDAVLFQACFSWTRCIVALFNIVCRSKVVLSLSLHIAIGALPLPLASFCLPLLGPFS